MLFLSRAKAICALAGVVCLASSMAIEQGAIVPGAVTMRDADASGSDEGEACIRCHKEEVDGFRRSKMGHSMRLPAMEPEGTARAPQAAVRMVSNREGTWQTLESHGENVNYRVSYVIGSGTHASGYIVS